MNRYKSPFVPPLDPASPFPDSLILVPSSTPLGILTVTFSFPCVFPLPLQFLHGVSYRFSITTTLWTGLLNCEKPWFVLTFPLPEQ